MWNDSPPFFQFIQVSRLAQQNTLATLLSEATFTARVAATGIWLPNPVAAPDDSGVISATQCLLRQVMAVNSHPTTTVYLQLFDADAVPANGTVPRLPSVPIAPGQSVILAIDMLGRVPLANGLTWASSSTPALLTITAINPLQVSADLIVVV